MNKPYAEHLRTEEAWCSGLTERLKALGFTDSDVWNFWNENPGPRLEDMEQMADMAVVAAIRVNEENKGQGNEKN